METVRRALLDVFRRSDAWLDQAPEVLQFRPESPGAWSTAEHLEHILLCNHFLLLTIGKGCAQAVRRAQAGEEPEGESDLERLSVIAVPGAFEWEPPRHMIPEGKKRPKEMKRELSNQLAECIRLLGIMPAGEGRLRTIAMSVHSLGRLDMYQWIYFLVQHMRYHLALLEKRTGA